MPTCMSAPKNCDQVRKLCSSSYCESTVVCTVQIAVGKIILNVVVLKHVTDFCNDKIVYCVAVISKLRMTGWGCAYENGEPIWNQCLNAASAAMQTTNMDVCG